MDTSIKSEGLLILATNRSRDSSMNTTTSGHVYSSIKLERQGLNTGGRFFCFCDGDIRGKLDNSLVFYVDH